MARKPNVQGHVHAEGRPPLFNGDEFSIGNRQVTGSAAARALRFSIGFLGLPDCAPGEADTTGGRS